MILANQSYLEINTLENLSDCIDSIGSNVDVEKINYIYLKEQKYEPVWELQKQLHLLVKEKKLPDLVLFLGSLAASSSVESLGNKKNINIEYLDRGIEYILK